MNITIRSGLVKLVDDVRAYLAARSTGTNVSIGWKKIGQQINQGEGGANRVVFQPALDNGEAGELKQPELVGPRDIRDESGNVIARARSIANWERKVVVSVWAVDPSNPEDETSTIEATETLFELVRRAVQASAKAGAIFGKVAYTMIPVERSFGRELRAELVLKHPLYDEPQEVAFPVPGTITKEIAS